MKATHALWLLLLLQLAATVSASVKIVTLLTSDPAFERLIRALQKHRLIPFLNNSPSLTLFAPTNRAFQKWDAEGREVTREILLYHILPETVLTDQFKDGQLLETVLVKAGYLGDNNEGQRVPVAKQSWRPGRHSSWTVGDAEILKKDWVADNGAVQVVDRLLVPPEDIVETLKKHTDLQLLYDILDGAGLDELLKHHRPFTVFAPTKNALDKLNPVQIQYLRHPQGKDDLDITIQHHVHAGVLYKENFAHGTTGVSTLEGQDLMVLNVDDKFMVDNAEIIRKDILASNGVIHAVSRPLLPSALIWTAAKYLIGSNATRFVTAMRDANLGQYIDDPNASFTIFATRDDDDTDSFWSLQNKQSENTRDLLKYHIVRGRITPDDLKDGQLFATELSTTALNDGAQRSKLTIQQSRRQKSLYLNGIKIIGEPLQVGKSMIYFIAKPLELPPKLVKLIKADEKMSVFASALKETGLDHRLSDARGVTVFAPDNAAWESLGVVTNYLMNASSVGKLEQVAMYTAGLRVLYSSDIKQGRTTLMTSASETLFLEKTNNDEIYVGEGRLDQHAQVGGRVVQRDILVDSGVVHKVSSVALPPSLEITLYNVLQGAGAYTFLRAFESANITSILKEWDQDYTIFAPSDQAFEEAGLKGALNDRDFVALLVRLHVVPGKIIRLEEDIDVDEASLLNDDAKLSFRDIHGDGKKFGVRVKGARSKKEARIVAFGKGHPARPTDDNGAHSKLGLKRQFLQEPHAISSFDREGEHEPQHGGIVYVIDRVLLPSDVSRLSQAWIYICMVMLALVVALGLCLLTAAGVHALVQEIRQIEGYQQVPQDEEAAATVADGTAVTADTVATEGHENDTAATNTNAPPDATAATNEERSTQ
ncbi:hypothetical protein BGW41_000669 [Actinomortierella wolfii]|nr:hypothetical protein BGW41_000669 [Actinomortierella wolfii]